MMAWLRRIAAAIGLMIGVYVCGRMRGASNAKGDMVERDRKDADDVRKMANDARGVDGDATARLRDHGGLRD